MLYFYTAFHGLDGLTPLICGEEMTDIFATDFTPGIVISSKEDLSTGITESIEDNFEDLPNKLWPVIFNNDFQSLEPFFSFSYTATNSSLDL